MMQTAFGKRCVSGGLAVVAGVAALGGSLITAQASLAAVPAAGVACNPNDGKVNGRGSTYQTTAQATFWTGFSNDICGATPSSGGDAAGANMGIYNYPGSAGFTGSGNGIIAANCRTDAYSGTDSPYTEAQLGQLNGPAGNASIGGCTPALLSGLVQPFAPDSTTNGTTYPNSGDQATPIMSFPIAGSSVAIAIKLDASDCTSNVKPSGLVFTGAQMAYIWGGDAVNWNDPTLVSGNPSLSTCGVPVTRVVRVDTSGTSSIFKNYLVAVDPTRAGEACQPGVAFATGSNTTWPTGSGCDALTSAGGTNTGGPALLAKAATIHGAVGYADLADEAAVVSADGFVTASLENGAGTAAVSPAAGKAANCDFSVLGLPGSGLGGDTVGLNTADNWGSDNTSNQGASNHVNATDKGVKYPICGITFDLVYSNLGLGTTGGPNAISQLTADQRRTLYSYITYVLSSTGQNTLSKIFYAPIPSTWLSPVQQGFQANY